MAQQSMRKLILSASIAAALAVSSASVFADGSNTEELEARIAELEALVQQLLNQPAPAPKADDCCADAEAATAAAEEKFNAMMAEHKAAVAEQEHKHSYAFGGYIKLDSIYSDYSAGSSAGAGRDFYIPATIPVGSGDGESYLDFHAKESRVNFKSTHNLDNGSKVVTFFEMDFHLSGQGDERISNSYSPRVRHAFFTYNKWLFGQTWMTFFNVGALPENLDFVGPAESTVFGRQAMIRYTSGSWQFAAENPETTITPYGGGSRIVADDNRIPDLVGRLSFGSFTVTGMLRELRYDNNAGVSDSTSGWGVSLSGKHMIGTRDDFRWMATAGSGLGRYVGLNTTNDAVLDANGNLQAIDQMSIFGSYRHFWNDAWRSNLTLGYLSIDNDTALTGMGATSDASSLHVNLIYSPVPKMDFGVELMYADREIESGADGDLTRLQFSAKYAF
jgi:hypothetical protein